MLSAFRMMSDGRGITSYGGSAELSTRDYE